VDSGGLSDETELVLVVEFSWIVVGGISLFQVESRVPDTYNQAVNNILIPETI